MEFIIIIVALIVYFLPSIIGYGHRNFASILLLNIFLGWTAIGWIVAIVWAASDDKKTTVVVEKNSKSVAEQLNQLKELADSGILTKEEFEIQKTRILK